MNFTTSGPPLKEPSVGISLDAESVWIQLGRSFKDDQFEQTVDHYINSRHAEFHFSSADMWLSFACNLYVT